MNHSQRYTNRRCARRIPATPGRGLKRMAHVLIVSLIQELKMAAKHVVLILALETNSCQRTAGVSYVQNTQGSQLVRELAFLTFAPRIECLMRRATARCVILIRGPQKMGSSAWLTSVVRPRFINRMALVRLAPRIRGAPRLKNYASKPHAAPKKS